MSKIILLASGTGLGPIKAMIEDFMVQPLLIKKLHLYWGGRTISDLYMDSWIRSLVDKIPNFTYHPILSDQSVPHIRQGKTQFVHTAVLEDFTDIHDYAVFACGSPLMIEAAQLEFSKKINLKTSNFFSDSFFNQSNFPQ